MAGKAEAKTDKTVEEGGTAKTSPGPVVVAVAAILAAFAGGAGAFLFAPASSAVSESDEAAPAQDSGEAAAHDAKAAHDPPKDKKKKKKQDKHSASPDVAADAFADKVQIFDEAAFFTMDPLIVSIAPIGRSRHLKVTLVLETPPHSVGALPQRLHYIRDVSNTYLRTVDAADFENPAAMARLRTQLLRRVRTAAPEAEVRNILITEFILT